jgi:hypothetical protein
MCHATPRPDIGGAPFFSFISALIALAEKAFQTPVLAIKQQILVLLALTPFSFRKIIDQSSIASKSLGA